MHEVFCHQGRLGFVQTCAREHGWGDAFPLLLGEVGHFARGVADRAALEVDLLARAHIRIELFGQLIEAINTDLVIINRGIVVVLKDRGFLIGQVRPLRILAFAH